MSAPQTPRVWLVIGDKPGDNAQIQAIADALTWPYSVKTVIPREKYVFGKPWFRPSLRHLDPQRSAALTPPWPDLILTIGRRPAMAALWIRRQSGNHSKIVILGRPRGRLDDFALVIVTRQYKVPRWDNVLLLDLPLMEMYQARLEQAAKIWKAEFARLKHPLTAVLIGGPTQSYRLDEQVIADLLARAEAQTQGGCLYISTSRRTPAAVIEYLKQHTPAHGLLYIWRPEAQRNPYPGLLALADQFVVTGDSISMLVEIARLGKPLVIYPLPEKKASLLQVLRYWGRGLGVLPEKLRGRLFGYTRDPGEIHRYLWEKGFASRLGEPVVHSDHALHRERELQQVTKRIHLLLDNRG